MTTQRVGIKKTTALISFLLFGYIYSVTAAQSSAMPLTYVADKAIENNPEVQQAWYAFRASVYGVDAALSGYLPTVDMSASSGYEKRNYGIESKYSRNTAELTLNQMLYDGFRTANTVKRFKHIQLVRYYEMLYQAETTARQAAIAFLDVQKFNELVVLTEQKLAEHRAVYQQIEQSVRAGVARAVDLEQINGRLSLAQSNVITEYANLHDVSARYLRVIGELPSKGVAKAKLNDDALPISINQALDIAYKNSPNFYATLYNIAAQQANAASQKAAFHPNIDLSARYGMQDRDELGLNETRSEARVSIDLRYNLYNGGQDDANLSQAYQEVNAAKFGRDQTCIEIRQNLQIAYNEIKNLDDKIPSLLQHKESSTKVKYAYKDQFDIGQRTLLDVLDAENESFEAKRAYTSALYERQVAIVTLLAEMGKLLPTLAVSTNKFPNASELTDDPIALNPQHICPKYDVATTINRQAFLEKKKQQDNAYMNMTALPNYLTLPPLEASPATETPPSPATYIPAANDDKTTLINEFNSGFSPSVATIDNEQAMGQNHSDTTTMAIGIPFAADSSTVRPEYISELAKLADFLRLNPTKHVEIQGHASLDGEVKYNKKLSEQRAFAVAQTLIEQFNIAPQRVTSLGYGIDQPKIKEISVRANAQNRRIEAVIITPSTKSGFMGTNN